MKRSLIVVLIILAVFSCKPGIPSVYIQPDELEDILCDYHKALAMARDGNSQHEGYDENAYFLAVLQKHGVTEADYDSSMVYYYTHADRLKSVFDNVSERLTAEASSMGAPGEMSRMVSYSNSGDTANIWNAATETMLMPLPTINRFDFSLKADTSYRKGDSFLFEFRSDYIYETGNRDAVVCLLGKYEGDSIIQTVYHITSSGLTQIRVPANDKGALKEMTGFIYLNSDVQQRDVRRIMFVHHMHLIRFHKKKESNETANQKAQADSLSGTGAARRPGADSASSLPVRGEGRPVLHPDPGTPVHRMDLEPSAVKKIQ